MTAGSLPASCSSTSRAASEVVGWAEYALRTSWDITPPDHRVLEHAGCGWVVVGREKSPAGCPSEHAIGRGVARSGPVQIAGEGLAVMGALTAGDPWGCTGPTGVGGRTGTT